MIPANAIVLRSVKCSDIHKCIAGYGKATLYGVVDLGRKEEVCQGLCDVIYGLQGAPGEAMSSQKYLYTSKAIAV